MDAVWRKWHLKNDKQMTLSPRKVGMGIFIFYKIFQLVIVGVSPSLPRLRAATSLRKINSCSFNSFKMLQLRSKPTFNADTHILLVKILILFFLNVHLMLGPTLKMTSSHGSSRRWQSQMIPHFCRLSPELKWIKNWHQINSRAKKSFCFVCEFST